MAKWPWVSQRELQELQESARQRTVEENRAEGWRQRANAMERERDGLRETVASLERQVDHLREATEQWQSLYHGAVESKDNLVNTMIEMKREGFVPAPFASTGNLEKLNIDLPEPVMDAIAQRSDPSSALERQLNKWALGAMREKGATPELVADRILKGGTPPPEEDEEG